MVSGSNPECHPGADLLVAVDNLTVRSEEQRWALAKKRLDLLFKQVEFIDTTQQHVKVAEMWHEQVPSMGVVSELFNEKHHNDIAWDNNLLMGAGLVRPKFSQFGSGYHRTPDRDPPPPRIRRPSNLSRLSTWSTSMAALITASERSSSSLASKKRPRSLASATICRQMVLPLASVFASPRIHRQCLRRHRTRHGE